MNHISLKSTRFVLFIPTSEIKLFIFDTILHTEECQMTGYIQMDAADGDDHAVKPGQGTLPSWRYVPRKRRLLPEDPFYDDGNIHCSVQFKQMPVDIEESGSGTM